MTHPAVLYKERTGEAPGNKPDKIERTWPITKSRDMDKNNRFYKQVKQMERLNNGS